MPIAYLNPRQAAKRLGVSPKALRLYEQRGLLSPARSAAGWRAYGPEAMAQAEEIVALRALGLSLAEVAGVLSGDPGDLGPALAAHQATLEGRMRQLAGAVERVRELRAGLARGRFPQAGDLAQLLHPGPGVAFDLPWPWGGERFELRDIGPLTFIVGPLGSGKTRLAMRLAECLPGGAFVGLDRLADGNAAALVKQEEDPTLQSRVERALAWLEDDGATPSAALTALLVHLETDGPKALVVDMVEQGLDQVTQQAVIAHLRRGTADRRPLFLMTRSNAILDLALVGAGEAIILCPANHSPPTLVAPYPGAPGYEAVATCLASPAVRARTAGVVVLRPKSGLEPVALVPDQTSD